MKTVCSILAIDPTSLGQTTSTETTRSSSRTSPVNKVGTPSNVPSFATDLAQTEPGLKSTHSDQTVHTMLFIQMIPDRQRQYRHKAASRGVNVSGMPRYESRVEFTVGSVKKMFIQSNLGNSFNKDTLNLDVLLANASMSFVGKDWDDKNHLSLHQSSYCSWCTDNPKTSRSQPLCGMTP